MKEGTVLSLSSAAPILGGTVTEPFTKKAKNTGA